MNKGTDMFGLTESTFGALAVALAGGLAVAAWTAPKLYRRYFYFWILGSALVASLPLFWWSAYRHGWNSALSSQTAVPIVDSATASLTLWLFLLLGWAFVLYQVAKLRDVGPERNQDSD